uniref:Telomerase reverse transcriptase n=1 Tax=Macrostomum lignano TaxID=282301 RepID=A0A1I8F5J7_9PLAT
AIDSVLASSENRPTVEAPGTRRSCLRLLLAGLIFGPVHRRFQRYAVERAASRRVPSLEFLCRLPQCVCERHSRFVRSLLLRLRQHLLIGLCQAKVYKNFTNSAAHRQKHRIFCALLCLAPHLPMHADLVLDWMRATA